MWIAFILTLIASAALLIGAKLYCRKRLQASTGPEREELTDRFRAVDHSLKDLTQYVDSYTSKQQLETVLRMVGELNRDLESEREALKTTEVKLETAQKSVEEKEATQQEMKSAKEEDEQALAQMLANYSDISTDSVRLEQQLAESLRNLDNMLEELELTADQRAYLEELSRALTNAGALLRDLITEHGALNERLNLLKQQHEDLEDEYTRLVEQQLGE